MSLLREEKIKLFLSEHERLLYAKISDVFNTRHPKRIQIGFSIVGKVVRKFDVELTYQVHVNFTKHIELCITNVKITFKMLLILVMSH